jgi:hypothetical protein
MKNWQIVLVAIFGGFILDEFIRLLSLWKSQYLIIHHSAILFHPDQVGSIAKILYFSSGIILGLLPLLTSALIAMALYRRKNKV